MDDIEDETQGTEEAVEASESEDEDEEEVEPKLKYERIGNDMTNILSKDAASCMAVHPKFLVLGTHWGNIHVMDHLGTNISNKQFPAHTTTVNHISIDAAGDHLASCSDDGRVVITGLYSNESNLEIDLNRPVKSVALDPNFHKAGSGKLFVTGTDKLILNERGFFSRHKQLMIHQGEGLVRTIKWRGHYIAWANDKGVKVYDVVARKKITFIEKEHKLRPELYRCNLQWKDDITLLIAWADSVKVCVVKESPDQKQSPQPLKYMEITSMFNLELYVSGLGPLGANLVIMAYSKHEEQSTAERPQLLIISPAMEYYDEVCNDVLSLRGFENYHCNDYHLECIAEESTYFIVSPKDVICAKPRTEDDHISWLLEHNHFERALDAAIKSEKQLKRHTKLDVGVKYLDHLLSTNQWDEAARLCVKILGKSKDLWQQHVFKFADHHQLKAVSPYLPRGPDLVLDPSVYEMVLNEYLCSDLAGFYTLVRDWPDHLYSVQAVVTVVEDRLNTAMLAPDDVRLLKQALGDLNTKENRYDKALQIYLELGHTSVFDLIHQHDLFSSIADKIVLLMNFDPKRAVKLLLDNMDKVAVDVVVRELDTHPHLQHLYLDGLFNREPHNPVGRKYHGLMVSLYAVHDTAKLLSFLKASSDYPLQQALEECQRRQLIPEMVFLLSRMGDTKRALALIISGLKDIQKAIAFCKEQDDSDLWQDLIDKSLDKPLFIRVLLHNIGTHVDPILLIRRIKHGLEIPGLRDSLVKILQDYNLQISLREGCKKILVSDSFKLLDRMTNTRRRGVRVDDDHVCQSCNNPVITHDLRFASNVMVFFCSHVYHEDCMTNLAQLDIQCPLCSSQKKSKGMSS